MAFLSQPKRSMFQLNESDLLCKNSCGFYGNPEWHGLCSKCFRDYQKKAETSGTIKRLKDRKEVLEEKTTSAKVPVKSSSSFSGTPFDRFVSKKKQQSERKTHTMKSIFSGSLSNKEVESEHTKPLRQISVDVQVVVKDFNEFLLTLPKNVAADIASRIQAVSKKLTELSVVERSVDELSKIASNFYEEFTERLNRHALFSELTEEMVTKILDYSESYIVVRSYKYLFCPATTDDEEKDLIMQNRVRKLNWVTSNRLAITIDEINPEVREELDSAITDIIEVDTKKTVDAKLKCVVSCCRHVAQMLALSGNGPASADQFLPAVIYVVLRANPPRLQSNIKFVTRFANPNHLRTGEAGYFFTMLCCAVSFIDNMDAKALEMAEDEFQGYMTGDSTSAAAIVEQQAFVTDGLRQMNKNLQILGELKQRQLRLIENIKEEQQVVENFHADCLRRLRTCQEKYPLEVRSRKSVMDLDSDLSSCRLPPPLIPIPSGGSTEPLELSPVILGEASFESLTTDNMLCK